MPVADEKNKIYTKKTVFQKAKSPEIPDNNKTLKTASANAFPKKEIKTTSKPANAINRKPAEKNTASGSNNVQKNSSIIIENDIILLKRKMHREIFQRRLERKLFTIIEEREEMVEEI